MAQLTHMIIRGAWASRRQRSLPASSDRRQGTGGATGFTVSDNGTLAYHEGTQAVAKELVAVSRIGALRRLPGAAVDVAYPSVSPDGKTIVANVTTDTRVGVSLIDVSTGALERLTAPDSGRNPEWTRDGARVVVVRRRGDTVEYVSLARDRSSVPRSCR